MIRYYTHKLQPEYMHIGMDCLIQYKYIIYFHIMHMFTHSPLVCTTDALITYMIAYSYCMVEEG